MSRRDLRSQHPNSLNLTAKDAAFSLIERTSRAGQCEWEKGSDRPPTDMEADREGPVSGEGVTGRALTLPIQRKIA
jgi:hypothetical protein